tara:strand:+ start:1233 stop:1385 length:153 start_codon:yes stop_codon:yes gene_type:complete
MPKHSITLKEAISIVLEDLHNRIPKTKKEGFVADSQLSEAISRLLDHISK